jgi:hypothetical protein
MIEARLTKLFQYYPVVAVLGARQAGKSTFVETVFSGTISVTVFDPVVDIGNARQDPDFSSNLSSSIWNSESPPIVWLRRTPDGKNAHPLNPLKNKAELLINVT